jgi:hypothetical protein
LKTARVAIPNSAIGPIPTFVAKEPGYYRSDFLKSRTTS